MQDGVGDDLLRTAQHRQRRPRIAHSQSIGSGHVHVQPGLEPDAAGAPSRIVARRKRALVFVRLEEVWAFEAAERLAYVHTARGRFDVDLSLAAVEASFGRTLLRVHRKWLVNTEYVSELEGAGLRVPVARERARRVRAALLGNTLGIRAR